jgi:uncharacterized membrane protein
LVPGEVKSSVLTIGPPYNYRRGSSNGSALRRLLQVAANISSVRVEFEFVPAATASQNSSALAQLSSNAANQFVNNVLNMTAGGSGAVGGGNSIFQSVIPSSVTTYSSTQTSPARSESTGSFWTPIMIGIIGGGGGLLVLCVIIFVTCRYSSISARKLTRGRTISHEREVAMAPTQSNPPTTQGKFRSF